MQHVVNNKWQKILSDEFEKPYFKDIQSFLDTAYKTTTVYPIKQDIFNALSYTDYDNVKVVILGQDPYHGDGQAHGLSFSVRKGIKIPPSLRNIYKELAADLQCEIPNHGCLDKWAKQGVLLLNAVLTVKAHEASSHSKIGWQQFTDAIIKHLNERDTPMVFVLWGNYAKSKSKYITNPHHMIITSVHPSPLSASRGFFGSKPFSKVNKFLEEQGMIPIDWQIESEVV